MRYLAAELSPCAAEYRDLPSTPLRTGLASPTRRESCQLMLSRRSHPGRTETRNAARGGHCRGLRARTTRGIPHESTPS